MATRPDCESHGHYYREDENTDPSPCVPPVIVSGEADINEPGREIPHPTIHPHRKNPCVWLGSGFLAGMRPNLQVNVVAG